MSFVLNWHVAEQELESALAILTDLAPWGWEELARQGGFVLRVQVQERKQLKQLQSRICKSCPQARLDTEKVKDADWQTAWKFFFQPVEVAQTFCILPPWKVEEHRSDSLTPLVIHPQMAFGTGHHPTTYLCLQAMAELKKLGNWPEAKTVLDVGTGSGILAIAAASLGSPCVALDIDPVALDNARENVRANGVESEVCLFCGHVACLRADQSYLLVVANILSGPLIRMASTLTGLVQPGGTLILSGVLSSQVDSVSRAYQVHGLKEPRIEHRGEWASLMWVGESMK